MADEDKEKAAKVAAAKKKVRCPGLTERIATVSRSYAIATRPSSSVDGAREIKCVIC